MTCTEPDCSGALVDGYCDICGLARRVPPLAAAGAGVGLVSVTAVTGSSTQRRTATARRATSALTRLGAGLVDVPPVPSRDPATAVLAEPTVDENRRFCSRCDEPVGRSRDGAPGRTEGFCPSCGAPFSFTPKLAPGDLVGGQYEVVGCLAHGGMGWIYLAKDHNVSERWVVLKGLLNTADEGAMAAALAERRFLAEVEHPNIVKIFNFVDHESSGYIVMEYVDGTSLRQLMAGRREANGGAPDPLPAPQAIAYVLEILPAFAHLHRSGLLFCDFKLDNVIQTRHSVKLIDLGAVYRMDDRSSPVYGTVGYQAPEITETGPTVPSDLFTLARTLAVMCIDFRGYQSTYRFTLPGVEDVPLFMRHGSLHRFLMRGTASDPDDRFQSAEEMATQLLGVLREVVAEIDGVPVPGPSSLFTAELRTAPHGPDVRCLPVPQVAADDPAAGYLVALGATEPEDLIELLEAAPERTIEVELRRARALVDAGRESEAVELAESILAGDPWEWRAEWYQGVARLASDEPAAAADSFASVYEALPGELAPKLALGMALEGSGDHAAAARWYDVVSRTDPGHTAAAFGLGRCRELLGDTSGALAAYDRVPPSSSAFLDARVAAFSSLVGRLRTSAPTAQEVQEAAAALESLPLDREERARLSIELLDATLELLERDAIEAVDGARLLEHPLDPRGVRLGLEERYRYLAQRTATPSERIRLVDRANGVRPRTWR